jgi:asparagine synthase (glutamine-hydrolysing)
MCGILGCWTPRPFDKQLLNAALSSMHHRGPDDCGVLVDTPVSIGMTRLSIIDLEGGRQPIWNEDRTVAAVCNGEIYNYLELREELVARGHHFFCSSDTEVLVHTYESAGPMVSTQLRGMFAFAIWDRVKRKLLLSRDRFGKKPLYYTRTPSGDFLFASELKALRILAKAFGEDWSIRQQSVYDYLSVGMVPQRATIYENVFALGAGESLEFDGQNVSFEKYWRPVRRPTNSVSFSDAQSNVRTLISEAVRLRLRSDVPLGVFLSGGIDSSVVAYEASKIVGGSLKTFTVSVPGTSLDESPIAQRTAQALGVENTVLPLEMAPTDLLHDMVRLYDQPFADPSASPGRAVSRAARQHVTVVLTGDGGDEIFAGYRRHIAAKWLHAFRWLPEPICRIVRTVGKSKIRRSAAGLTTRFLRGLPLTPAERYLVWTSDMLMEADKCNCWRGSPMVATESWISNILSEGNDSGLSTQLHGDIHINLLSDLLVKMDMATMSASLEARSPLLDHRLAEFVMTLPKHYLVGVVTPKRLLRRAYEGLLPREVIHGPKRGFEVPIAMWLQTDWREIIQDTVLSNQARVFDYLDPRFVRNLCDKLILRDRNWAYLCYALLVLELWLRWNSTEIT